MTTSQEYKNLMLAGDFQGAIDFLNTLPFGTKEERIAWSIDQTPTVPTAPKKNTSSKKM